MGDHLLGKFEEPNTTKLTLLKAIIDVLRESGLTCFVIVDALDEFQESSEPGRSRSNLIETLWKLPVKLLVTGRDIPSIRSEFKKHRQQPVLDSGAGSEGLTWSMVKLAPDDSDLKDYIRWRVENGGTFQALKEGSAKLLDDMQSILVASNRHKEQ
jgi:hypothetical protein